MKQFDNAAFCAAIDKHLAEKKIKRKLLAEQLGVMIWTLKGFREKNAYPRVEVFLRACELMNVNPTIFLR